MFTGIIETLGKVTAVRASGDGMTLSVNLGQLASQVKLGDSVAVNGLCLTATKISGEIIDFDVSKESLSRSTISNVKAGDSVNIELAMKADGRFGGHIVQGHVDGIAKISKIEKHGQFWDVTLTAASNLLDEMVAKGSVTVSGISLTISKLGDNGFTIAVIPATIEHTTLKNCKVGDSVNIETDILGKMVKKQVSKMLPEKGLSLKNLMDAGF